MKTHLPPTTRQPETASGLKTAAQWAALAIALALILFVSIVPLGFYEQLVFAMLAMGMTFMVRPENETKRYRLIVLMVVSFGITCRYIYWRITVSMGWFDPEVHLGFWDHFFSIGLLLAEVYAWAILFLGFIQSIWPLRRPVLPLPVDSTTWPTIDVYIPTYNEPLNIVVPSILAARDLDWPKDKLNVYVLDDGCRPEFEAFSRKVGVRYIQREDSAGAKAGNINHALRITDGEYVAIFDCDHAPVRSFLRKTMGWFLRDGKLGLLQTPHLFFTPDPVERNLNIFKKVPNEGQLFYGLVQDGNDNWNAAFFCGSCAVLRRKALDEIGGITADTVTEDAHTSLKMHKQGWNSAYLNMPLAAGLATEKLSQHIGQRRRWARGMTQIFRRDNPLFASGLNLWQRLSYFNAMLHFLFSVPRLVFLTAPLAYLLFEVHVIQASAAMIAVYALPHIFQAHIANAAMQGRFRHSFWAEVYETILAPHIVIPTLVAFIAPKSGRFNVTNKGGVIDKDHFDWASAGFIFFLLLLNLLGWWFAWVRYFYWNSFETDTVLLNFLWTVYNTIIIGAALAVAWEKRQRRKHPRVPRDVPARVITADGRQYEGVTHDLSIGDLSVEFKEAVHIPPHEFVDIELIDKDQPVRYRARVATSEGNHVGVVFEELTANQLAKLVYFTHGKEKAWNSWYLACEPSKPLRSFLEIVRFGIIGVLKALFKREQQGSGARFKPRYAVLGWLVLLIILAIGGILYPQYSGAAENTLVVDDSLQSRTFTLSDLGVAKDISLRGGNTDDDVWFSLPTDLLVKQARLDLGFSLSDKLLPDYQALRILLNEREIGRVELNEATTEAAFRHSITIDPLLISYSNRLSFKLEPRNENYCERLDPAAAEAVISNKSRIRLAVETINLVNDLSLFPAPFFDARDIEKQSLPFVFSGSLSRDRTALKAAVVLASWFGVKAGGKLADFPVYEDAFPRRHSVVFITSDFKPGFLSDLEIKGPGVAMVSHPQKPEEKLLVIMGRNASDLIAAVNTLIARADDGALKGNLMAFSSTVSEPPARQPYDAPRWLTTHEKNRFKRLVDPSRLSVEGLLNPPVTVDIHVPPDLYSPWRDSLRVDLGYGYSGVPLSRSSGLDIALNGEGVARYGFDSRANGARDAGSVDGGPPVVNEKHNVSFSLPLEKLSGNNKLSMYFDFRTDDSRNLCLNQGISGISGTIDPDSGIDLTGFSHYGRFPELRHFVSLMFPFTRYADLGETALVVRENPGADDIRSMLNLMARAGSATGYPVYHVEIAYPGNVLEVAGRDLLLIGKYPEHDLIQHWKTSMPVYRSNGQWRARGETLSEWFGQLFNGEPVNSADDVLRYLDEQADDSVLLAGFRSPLDSGRDVVVVTATGARSLGDFTASLVLPDIASAIHGELSVVGKSEVAGFKLFPGYFRGDLPAFTTFRLFLARNVLALFLIFMVAVLMAAWGAKGLLKRHARERISTASPQPGLGNL